MPENTNISDGVLEEAFDKKVSTIINKDSASDDAIWQNTQELLNYELEKRLVWQRIRYFVSASAAAVIVLAALYIAFSPPGIPSNLLSAMEKEHRGFLEASIQPVKGFESPEELGEYFRQGNLIDPNECCCALFKNNKSLKLKGGYVESIDGCPCASIYADYKDTLVSFFLFNKPGLIGQTEESYRGQGQIWTDRIGEFNAVMKRLPNCSIGIISKLDKQTLVGLLKNINTLQCDCQCKHR
ncbi:MAG: hypothetical protein AB1599_10500 [Planctomycetota bacterium]